jgi:hypothetical protein
VLVVAELEVKVTMEEVAVVMVVLVVMVNQ